MPKSKPVSLVLSLALALLPTFVLHEFSYLESPKKVVRVTGSRDVFSSWIEKEFDWDEAVGGNIYVIVARFFEDYKGKLKLHFFLNGGQVSLTTIKKKVAWIEFPSEFLVKGKNLLRVASDREWRFKAIRLKNIYGYSSGLISFTVLNAQNKHEGPGVPRASPFFSVFLLLFFFTAFLLNSLPVWRKTVFIGKKKVISSLRHSISLLFIFILILPQVTKYRMLLELRSALFLALLYFALFYFQDLKAILKRAPKAAFRFASSWQNIIVLFALSRLCLFGLGYLSSLILAKGNWFWLKEANYFFSIFIKWDSFWYLKIMEQGYSFAEGKASNIAFFPLYPLLVKVSSFLIGTCRVNGFILSNLALFLAAFYLYKLVRLEYREEKSAERASLYLLIFPASLFFSLIYSEGLFILLSIAVFYYGRKKKWLAACLAGFFLSLTRIVGVLIAFPLLIEYLSPRLESGKIKVNQPKADILYVLLVPLGLISFMLYCFLRFGDFLGFLDAHSVWNTKLVSPISTLTKMHLYTPFYRIIYLGFVIFALLLIVGLFLKKLRAGYIVYSILLMSAYLSANLLDAMPRLVSVVFPLYIGMALLGKNRLLHQTFLFFSFTLLALFTILYANGYWFI